MISVFVVEDEIQLLDHTLSMLNELDANVVGHASSIDQAYTEILNSKPELVLLDVEVGEQTSFDLLNRFSAVDFKIIFITAHHKYAVEAFRFSAIDFLLKPVSLKALDESIQRAQNAVLQDQAAYLQTLQHNLKADSQEQKIILKTNIKSIFISWKR